MWDSNKAACSDNMNELAEVFSGEKPLSKIK